MHSEVRILLSAFKSLLRRPLQPARVKPGFRRFGAVETSGYGNIVAMLLLVVIAEAPAVHLIVGMTMEEGTLREIIRGLLLGSSVYVALWLLGDLRLLRETPGILLGRDTLVFELGVRVIGEVELRNVLGAQQLVEPHEAASRTLRITPFPQPNCRIRLRSAVRLRGLLGIPLTGDTLDVFTDDPAGLVTAIEAAVADPERDGRVSHSRLLP